MGTDENVAFVWKSGLATGANVPSAIRRRSGSVSRPTLTIIAGRNGAGKSTLTAGNPGTFAASPLLEMPPQISQTV
jgi:hypothetical protein